MWRYGWEQREWMAWWLGLAWWRSGVICGVLCGVMVNFKMALSRPGLNPALSIMSPELSESRHRWTVDRENLDINNRELWDACKSKHFFRAFRHHSTENQDINNRESWDARESKHFLRVFCHHYNKLSTFDINRSIDHLIHHSIIHLIVKLSRCQHSTSTIKNCDAQMKALPFLSSWTSS